MWVSAEQIMLAKRMDLLTYLKNYEPENLVFVCNGTYCTREHDSLKISNNMWHWFSRNIGGKNALDYLMKVKGFSFVKAVEHISGIEGILPPKYISKRKDVKRKEFILPKENTDIKSVRKYLLQRGIDNSIIDYCYYSKLLIEDEKHHSCIFLGYDKGTPKYASVRSTVSEYKGDLSGSDKRFSFRINSIEKSKSVHVFESVIDLLSYATFEKRKGRNCFEDNLLSVSGVYKTEKMQDIPLALENYLINHPETETICLHFDNDEVGRSASRQIISALSKRYEVLDLPPDNGKDYNEYLINEIRKRKDLER